MSLSNQLIEVDDCFLKVSKKFALIETKFQMKHSNYKKIINIKKLFI